MAVFDFIEGWYNPHRRHSGLDYLSPISYEQVRKPCPVHETGATPAQAAPSVCVIQKGGSRMSDRALVVAAGLALMLVSVTAGWSQTDPVKLLVGRWAGEVRTETGTYDRTLIVKSLEERSGQLVAAAEYGDAKLARVQGVVEVINGEIVLRFMTPERKTAVLTLYKDGKNLMGPVSGAGQVGRSRGGDDTLRLRKVE
jgi:hypothetical protein